MASSVAILSGTGTIVSGLSLANVLQKVWWLFIYSGDIPKELKFVETQRWTVFSILMLVFIISFIMAGVLVGKKDDTNKIVFNAYDKIFTEFQVSLLFILTIPLYFLSVAIFYVESTSWHYIEEFKVLITDTILNGDNPNAIDLDSISSDFIFGNLDLQAITGENQFEWTGLTSSFQLMILSFVCLLIVIIAFTLFMSLLKKLKAGRFFSTSLVGSIILGTIGSLKGFNLIALKIILILLGGWLLTMSPWYTLKYIAPVAIILIVPRVTKKFKDIVTGVERINEGDLDYRIPVKGSGDLDKLAEGINGISGARAAAVREELKNQKLKTSLISNVSHDLKTPMTSMITYIDLLKHEGLDGPNSDKYLTILESKTRRLQQLSEDLFEAAKASSGDMKVNMETLELNAITHQCVGELGDKIENSNLQVIFNSDSKIALVEADGTHLSRVIENLFINVCKYALAGSRVYINIEELENDVTLFEIINISRDRIDVKPETLMERFTRGEESRNTEGSGLGLTIAKDLTELMGGSMGIDIEGDIFKVKITLNTAIEPPAIEAEKIEVPKEVTEEKLIQVGDVELIEKVVVQPKDSLEKSE